MSPPTKNDAGAGALAEGTIQFGFSLEDPSAETAITSGAIADLLAWRDILRRLELLGMDPARYDGYGYGNVSLRSDPAADDGFIISASQTSGEEQVGPADFVRITSWNGERFWVDAIGDSPPSSESLTHGMIYDADRYARCVLHVHSPEIWQRADKLPSTPAEVPYGSPAMAASVRALLAEHVSRPLIFTTRGHEDGVFAFGATVRDAGVLLLSEYARAIRPGGEA